MIPSARAKKSGDTISPESLGSEEYKSTYNVKYAYYTGSMYRGIASKELVIRMGQAGLMGFLGTAAMGIEDVESNIDSIQGALKGDQAYGVNLICHFNSPEKEMDLVELYLKKKVSCLEASAFMNVTPALVLYRLRGLSEDSGKVIINNKIIAKISRPEVAESFMRPAPKTIVEKLLAAGKIDSHQFELSQKIPMCDDVTVEADSGGHTDLGVATTLLPTIQRLRDAIMVQHAYPHKVRVGLAGGVGVPEAIAAAFVMGADFVCTGSINQCTVESGMSDAVKEMLQTINIQDTAYAPAGDMFEIGARVQVLKKGVFFPVRANKLFMLYSHYNALDEIPIKIQDNLQDKFFKRSFEQVFDEVCTYYQRGQREHEIERAEREPKHKMALIFRWYFNYSMRLALMGDVSNRVDFQVHTGPSLGAFNQWVNGNGLSDWRNRHVDEIAEMAMQEAAKVLNDKYKIFLSSMLKSEQG